MSKKPLAVFSSDWHAKNVDLIWSTRKEIYGDCGWGIQEVERVIREYDVPNLILGGDQFHVKSQRSEPLRIVRESVERITKNGLRTVYAVDGNHDLSQPSLMNSLCGDNVVRLPENSEAWAIGDYTIFGLDYTPADLLPAALENIPPCDILVTHQAWKEWTNSGFYGNVSMQLVKAPVKLLLSGDYHVTIALPVQREDGTVLMAASPGTIYLYRRDESPRKYVWMIYDDLSLEAIELRTRGVFSHTIDSPESLEAFVQAPLGSWPAFQPNTQLPESLQTNILLVDYVFGIPRLEERVLAAVDGRVHVVFREHRDAAETQGPDLAAVMAVKSPDLSTRLRKRFEDDPELVELALEVSDPSRTEEVLHEFWQRATTPEGVPARS